MFFQSVFIFLKADDNVPVEKHEGFKDFVIKQGGIDVALSTGFGENRQRAFSFEIAEQLGLDFLEIESLEDDQKISEIRDLGDAFRESKRRYRESRSKDDYDSLIESRRELFTYIAIANMGRNSEIFREYVLANLDGKIKMPLMTSRMVTGITKLNNKIRNGKKLYNKCKNRSIPYAQTKVACQKYQREIRNYQDKMKSELLAQKGKPHTHFSQVLQLINNQNPGDEFSRAKSLQMFGDELRKILKKKPCDLSCVNSHLQQKSNIFFGKSLKLGNKGELKKLINATEEAETFLISGAASASSFRGCMLKVINQYKDKYPYKYYLQNQTGNSANDDDTNINSMFLSQLVSGNLPYRVNECGKRSYVYQDEVDLPARGLFSDDSSLGEILNDRENSSLIKEGNSTLSGLKDRLINVSSETLRVRMGWIKRIDASTDTANERLRRQIQKVRRENIPEELKGKRLERIAIKSCYTEDCETWKQRLTQAKLEYFVTPENTPVLKKSRHQMVIMNDRPKGIHNTRGIVMKRVGSPIQSDILNCNSKNYSERIKCLNQLQKKYNKRQEKLKERIEGPLAELTSSFLGDSDEKRYENEQYSLIKISFFKEGLTELLNGCKGHNESWTNSGPMKIIIDSCKGQFKSLLSNWGLENNAYFKNLLDNWTVDNFNKMFQDVTAVEEFFGSGTISQYINRNCQYQYLRKNKPSALRGFNGEVAVSGMDPSQSLDRILTAGEPMNYLIGNNKIDGMVPSTGKNPNFCEPPTYVMSTDPPTEETRALVDKTPNDYRKSLDSGSDQSNSSSTAAPYLWMRIIEKTHVRIYSAWLETSVLLKELMNCFFGMHVSDHLAIDVLGQWGGLAPAMRIKTKINYLNDLKAKE